MNRFFIKDGFGEKGPLYLNEIKKLGLSKSSFVRYENSDKWDLAGNFTELNSVFSNKKHNLKVVLIVGVIIFILGGASIFIIEIQKDSILSSSAYEEIVPVPPNIDYEVSVHDKTFFNELFKDCNLSGTNKQLIRACNFNDSYLRNKAVNIAGKSAGEFNLGQICDIFDYCYLNWKYVNDARVNNYVEFASTTLQNGLNGDCDDFAVLVCSMIISIGGEARVLYAYGATSAHAFTEVNIGKTDISLVENYLVNRYKHEFQGDGIWSTMDKNGNRWLNLDWFSKHPGGKYFENNYGTIFYIIQGFCQDYKN
jgi:hypothetical protein